MVATPRSSAKLSPSMSAKKEKIKSPARVKEVENSAQVENPENGIASQAKRNNNPGIRMIHGRIYDSENGKTCHQCRQKTRDFTAACKNLKNNKPCTINFCHKCLLNRYGEKAEEVGALQDWVCPKCRGICNCSVCMKKRGHQPTGILIRAAKTNGFSSVSEMLQKVGPDNCQAEKAKKRAAPEAPVSPRKRGKENNFDGKINYNLSDVPLPSNVVKDNQKKVEVEGSIKLKNISATVPVNGNVLPRKSTKLQGSRKANGSMKHPTTATDDKLKMLQQEKLNEVADVDKNRFTFARRTSPRKHHISNETVNNDPESKDKVQQEVQDGDKNKNMSVQRTSPRKLQISTGTNKGNGKSNLDIDQHKRKLQKSKVHEGGLTETYEDKEKQEADTKHVKSAESDCREINFESGTLSSMHSDDNNKLEWVCQYDFNPEIQLPEGFELTSVHDIEIPPEDVGKAFQFLEFCAAFGQILGVRKGQPEMVLRDLIHGRSSRRGKHSVVIQFLIQLLSVIREERGQGSSALSQNGNYNSWMNALRECISKSGSVSKLLDLGSVDGFEYLDSSKKLMIINFLCDEILGTKKFRNWIDEKTKENKEKFTAAKDKEKTLKQQMQDEVAKAIVQKNGAALSISEHDAIVSKIKLEAAAAHANLELNESILKKKNQSSVVRTQPIYLGGDGRAYWRLNCSSPKSAKEIFLQDVGTGDTSGLNERWFAFEDEQREEIEKHINSLRGKRVRAQRIAVQRPTPN
ncbi:OLC1v1010770C1 [Oldenlandia corymbosa var. corymbosa]|uniref:OLC1v1010770C1 n=1 Tax=Oldenlandia corymbosa var. corymbosa TaxID=529605 RepID=A0AAV1DTT5_OLDCO|nr:OLC1v1010770C1 [Oldenlandia corymbosa var. corymbosa]